MSRYPANIITKSPDTPTGPNPLTGRAPGVWRLEDVAYWLKQGVWPDASADGYWPYTSLLLSSTSLSNANNNLFVDSSGAFNPVSRNGNTTQGSFSPYGSYWSNYFDGSGDYLTAPSNAAFGIGTGDYTIEAWVYKTSSSRLMVIAIASAGLSIAINTSGDIEVCRALTAIDFTFTAGISDNTWTHIAVARSGTSLQAFKNGVSLGTQTSSTSYGQSTCYVGIDANASSTPFSGYISNLRLVKGTAVYTANFTPPTAPLTAISGTSLLTCQSNRFIDNSSNAFAITVNGDTKVQKFSPFTLAAPGVSYNQSDITNWSGYFPGNGSNYLAGPSNAAFAMGTGDFTIEFWAYFTNSADDNGPIFDTRTSANNGVLIRQGNGAGGIANRVDCNCAGTTASSGTITFNAWTHVAVVRASSSLKIYLNGVGGTAVTASGNASASNSYIGAFFDGLSVNFDGYLNNLRVVKGTAVYTANFTPPTTNLTAVSGTSLLTLQNAAFTDNSTNNFVITPFGNTTATGNSPFNTTGYWSNYFNVSGYLRSTNSVFALGTGDFTMEMWVNFDKPTKTGGGQHNMMWVNYDTWGANSIFFGKHGDIGGYVALFCYNYNSGSPLLLQDPTLPTSGWMHYAVVRSGSSWKLFRNGVSVATATWSGNATSSTTSSVGGNAENGAVYGMEGYISNFRLTNTAVYSSNFTPSTTPLTAVSGTQFLTCQSSRFIDTSANAIAITPTNSVTVQSFDPFYTATIASNGGSMYFDGSGDYLTMPSNAAFQVGTGQFTLECWIYFNTVTNINEFLWADSSGTTGGRLVMYYSGGGLQIVAAGGAGATTASWTPVAGQWYHLAASRDASNNQRLFVNGVLLATATSTNDYTQNGFAVARAASLNGYMAGIRLVKGTALYTTTFTPPTAPVTPTAATTLLLNGMNAGIYDATTINDMETVGNAQVSTVQSKFGGSSMYFDGNGDWLYAPTSPQFGFGTGDFTIEFWLYVPSLPASKYTILDFRPNYSSGTPHTVYINSSGYMGFFNGSADVTSSSQPLSVNTWYHVAYSRNSGTIKIFVAGTQAYSGASSVDYLSTRSLTVGSAAGGLAGEYLNGYIDDLRITKGVARYTANFTPPTQAFPVY